MAQKPETKFAERALKDLRKLPFSWWTKIQQVAIRGTPDIFGSLCGTCVAIELKMEKGRLDALQKHNLDMLRDTGAIAAVVRPFEWAEFYGELVEYAKNHSHLGRVDHGNRGDEH